MFQADPNKATDELLKEICAAAHHSDARNPSLAYPPIAALLVRLSRDADTTADKNLHIQGRVIFLAKLMLAMTGVLFVVTLAMLGVQIMQYMGY